MFENKKLITDNGVVEKSSYISKIIIGICILVSIGLLFLGFMAYYVG